MSSGKYKRHDGLVRRYYESSLFNNEFLKNVIEETKDKFLIIGKENDRNFWSGTVDRKWYKEYDSRCVILHRIVSQWITV